MRGLFSITPPGRSLLKIDPCFYGWQPQRGGMFIERTMLPTVLSPSGATPIGGKTAGVQIGSLGTGLVKRNRFDTNEQFMLQEGSLDNNVRFLKGTEPQRGDTTGGGV